MGASCLRHLRVDDDDDDDDDDLELMLRHVLVKKHEVAHQNSSNSVP